MFPVKSEPSDTYGVGKDSQPTRCMEDNQDISDILNTDASDNWLNKSLSDEMLLTMAYVKIESALNNLDYNTLNTKGNKCIHGQRTEIYIIKSEETEACSDNTSGDITDIQTEKTEACSDNTSEVVTDIQTEKTDYTLGDVTDDEHVTIKAKEKYQHNHFIEHGIKHVTDMSQHYMVADGAHGTMQAKKESNMADISQHFTVGDREHGTMLVKEESHMADISQHYRFGGSDAINMGDICTSFTPQSNDKKVYTNIFIKEFIQERNVLNVIYVPIVLDDICI